MNTRVAETGVLRGGHVLAMLLIFFATVIAVDVGFSIAAVRTFPGEDIKNSYLQGLNYNATLAERGRERALGWKSTVSIVDRTGSATVVLNLTYASNAPIIDADIRAMLRRPATSRQDRALTFQHVGGGRYEAPVNGILPGVWVIQGVAHRNDQDFHFERRLSWRSTR